MKSKILNLIILPIHLLINSFRKIKTPGVKFKHIIINLGIFLVSLFFLLPIWLGVYSVGSFYVLNYLNLVSDTIPIAGTGSMYPTFPKGEGKTLKEQTQEIVGTPGMRRYPSGVTLNGKSFFSYEIGRGDIVSFYNEKTAELTKKDGGVSTGFIKRVIALPGDSVEIKDGILILNGSPQKEPYTAKARSTFGGTFLPDCKALKVPSGKLFVMGDNRKGSADSRYDLGFIDYKDIDHVISFKDQKGILDKNWRDTKNDLEQISKIRLDKNEYLDALNKKRKEAGAKPLKYQPKLEKSAELRGKVMLKYDDFSFEATKSGYTMAKAMNDAGYSNITWGEAPSNGYYESDELIENQFVFPDYKAFLLNSEYEEVGISEVEGALNGCPAQVIVQHFAGYIPPNYKEEDINSWKKLLEDLRKVQPGWADLKNFGEFYNKNKADIDRVNDIISQRISIANTIISRMEANQWLTPSEKELINTDEAIANEQDALATKLNNL